MLYGFKLVLVIYALYILAWHVPEDGVISVAVKEVLKILQFDGKVVSTADADYFFKKPGVSESKVYGMKGAKAATCRYDFLLFVYVSDERYQFL